MAGIEQREMNDLSEVDVTNSTFDNSLKFINSSSSLLANSSSLEFTDSMSQSSRDISTIESSCPSIDNGKTDTDTDEIPPADQSETFHEDSILFTSTQNNNTSTQNNNISRTPPLESELPPNSVSDETLVKEDGSASQCPCCDNEDSSQMIQCATCKSWLHFTCSALPPYQLYVFTKTQRKFECEMCINVPGDFLSKVKKCTADPPKANTGGTPDLSSQRSMLEDVLNNALRSLERNLVTTLTDNKYEIAELRLNAVTNDLSEEKRLKGNLERELAQARRKISELEQKSNQHVPPPSAALTEENASLRQSLADCLLAKENALGELRKITESRQQHIDRVEWLERDLARDHARNEADRERLLETERQLLSTQEALRVSKIRTQELSDEVLAYKASLAEYSKPTQPSWSSVAQEANRMMPDSRELSADSSTTSPSSSVTSSTMGQHNLTGHKQSSSGGDGQLHNMPRTKQPSATNQATRPQRETVEHSQPDLRSNTKDLDVLIIGNSHVSRIDAKKMYQKKTCEVVSLDNKSINGAVSYVRRCPLKPKTVILQVLSNDLSRYSVEDCLHNAQSLIDLCRNTFPESTIFMSEPLPRITSHPIDYNAKLQQARITMGTLRGCEIIKMDGPLAQMTSEVNSGDGIHLNRRGLGHLVRRYKAALAPSLGHNYSLERQQPSYRATPNPDNNRSQAEPQNPVPSPDVNRSQARPQSHELTSSDVHRLWTGMRSLFLGI